jgi:hypothetical protein
MVEDPCTQLILTPKVGRVHYGMAFLEQSACKLRAPILRIDVVVGCTQVNVSHYGENEEAMKTREIANALLTKPQETTASHISQQSSIESTSPKVR